VETPPETLYHYTNQTGLMGILESNSLWATKIHYLNDAQEFKLAIDLASPILERMFQHQTVSKNREKVRCLIQNLQTIKQLNVCVCSFSAERDLLSQWRAYASGGGYSIGFKTDAVRTKAASQDYSLVKCIYDRIQQRDLVEELISTSLKDDFNITPSKRDSKRPDTIILLPTGGQFSRRFAQLAPLLKNRAFHEEAEWRVVSNGGINSKILRFRPGRSMLLPYGVLKMGNRKGSYLASVTVGPGPHAELAKSAVSMLMSRWRGARGVKIVSSAASYRSW